MNQAYLAGLQGQMDEKTRNEKIKAERDLRENRDALDHELLQHRQSEQARSETERAKKIQYYQQLQAQSSSKHQPDFDPRYDQNHSQRPQDPSPPPQHTYPQAPASHPTPPPTNRSRMDNNILTQDIQPQYGRRNPTQQDALSIKPTNVVPSSQINPSRIEYANIKQKHIQGNKYNIFTGQ